MSNINDVIASIPFRMAFAGGWIDQPFVSKHDPDPPGSMVVVGLEPHFRFMNRAGFAMGTRKIAVELWKGVLPDRDPADLVKELYEEENKDRTDPSGSQDMIGMVYPGINRLDYDFRREAGVFPAHIESCNDPGVARWLEDVIKVVPVAPRPEGYHPLGVKNLDPEWVGRLGRTGWDCYDAIIGKDAVSLGRSMNECMECWEAILPHTVRHPTLQVDILKLLGWYQSRYIGAMYSGCGGGYLFVVSEEPVPGSFRVTVRLDGGKGRKGTRP